MSCLQRESHVPVTRSPSSGVAARMFQSLADAGVNVELIGTSEVCITVAVDGPDGHKALSALKKEFADAMV